MMSRSGGPGGTERQQGQLQGPTALVARRESRASPTPVEGAAPPGERRVNRLTGEGELLIASTLTRDQGRNLDDCLEKLRELILAALNPPKPRRATRPTLASKKRRVEGKQRRSETKRGRQVPDAD